MIKRLAFIFALLLLPMTPGWAEEAAAARPTKMAVVNMQEIIKQSKAATKLRDQLEAQKNTLQKDLSKEEGGLRDQEKELADKRGVLSADAFEQKRRDFQDKVAAFQKKAQERFRDLEQIAGLGNSQIRKTMQETVDEISSKNGYSVVFPAGELLFSDKSLDITDQVLKTLDQKLPEVKPEAPAAAANGHSKK